MYAFRMVTTALDRSLICTQSKSLIRDCSHLGTEFHVITYHLETVGVLSAAQFEFVLLLVIGRLEVALSVEEGLELRHSCVDFVHLEEQFLEDTLARAFVKEAVQVVLDAVIHRDSLRDVLDGWSRARCATIRCLNVSVARIGGDWRKCGFNASMLHIDQRADYAAV